MKDKCLKLRFRAISEFSETQVFDNGTLTIKDFGWSDRGRCTYSSHNFTNPEFFICLFFFKYRGSPDSTNFGSQDNRVIRGIVLIGD